MLGNESNDNYAAETQRVESVEEEEEGSDHSSSEQCENEENKNARPASTKRKAGAFYDDDENSQAKSPPIPAKKAKVAPWSSSAAYQARKKKFSSKVTAANKLISLAKSVNYQGSPERFKALVSRVSSKEFSTGSKLTTIGIIPIDLDALEKRVPLFSPLFLAFEDYENTPIVCKKEVSPGKFQLLVRVFKEAYQSTYAEELKQIMFDQLGKVMGNKSLGKVKVRDLVRFFPLMDISPLSVEQLDQIFEESDFEVDDLLADEDKGSLSVVQNPVTNEEEPIKDTLFYNLPPSILNGSVAYMEEFVKKNSKYYSSTKKKKIDIPVGYEPLFESASGSQTISINTFKPPKGLKSGDVVICFGIYGNQYTVTKGDNPGERSSLKVNQISIDDSDSSSPESSVVSIYRKALKLDSLKLGPLLEKSLKAFGGDRKVSFIYELDETFNQPEESHLEISKMRLNDESPTLYTVQKKIKDSEDILTCHHYPVQFQQSECDNPTADSYTIDREITIVGGKDDYVFGDNQRSCRVEESFGISDVNVYSRICAFNAIPCVVRLNAFVEDPTTDSNGTKYYVLKCDKVYIIAFDMKNYLTSRCARVSEAWVLENVFNGNSSSFAPGEFIDSPFNASNMSVTKVGRKKPVYEFNGDLINVSEFNASFDVLKSSVPEGYKLEFRVIFDVKFDLYEAMEIAALPTEYAEQAIDKDADMITPSLAEAFASRLSDSDLENPFEEPQNVYENNNICACVFAIKRAI